jgi:hypothetical protein
MSGVSEDQIDAIVGAALKAMVESGVGHARVGAFASSFRDEVAGILRVKQAKPAEPDLLQMVTQAVRLAMADSSTAPGASARKSETAERIHVYVGGKRTSVTLLAEGLRKLDEATGSRKEAKAIIQELAASAPADAGNRSAWIQERMLAFAGAKGDGASPRH